MYFFWVLTNFSPYATLLAKGGSMRVKKMEDLPPHNRLFEQMAFNGHFLPVLDGVKVIYYKIYRQADIIAPEGYKCPYVEYSPSGKEEHVTLSGTAAKIMLMRELVKNFKIGQQIGLELGS